MIRVNLLPEKKKIQLPWGLIILLGILGSALYGNYWFLYLKDEKMGFDTTKQFEPRLQSIKSEIDKIKKDIKVREREQGKELEEKQQEYEFKQREVSQLKQLTGMGVLAWSTVFEEFTRIINDNDVWVQSLSSQGLNKLTLRGIAKDNNNVVSKFLTDLENSENQIFSNVVLQQTSNEKKYNKPIINFSLTMNVKKNVGMDDE